MTKYAFSIFLICLFGCFGRKPSVNTGFEGKPMPSFNLLLMDSLTKINTSAIPKGQPTVIFFLNPHCPYCRAQTEELKENIQSLSNIQFYMVSYYPFNDLKKYYDDYQLKKYPNIIFGQDYDVYFSNYYKTRAVPYIAIYDKDKYLKQVFIGKISTNLIKDIALQ